MIGTVKQFETIAALLREENTLALATVDERGEPCIAPLFYLAGPDLSLFWLSSRKSLHSRNLIRSPRASATVYRHAETWKAIRGVQMRGSVAVVTDPARRKALIKLYCKRFELGTVFRLAIASAISMNSGRISSAISTTPSTSGTNSRSRVRRTPPKSPLCPRTWNSSP